MDKMEIVSNIANEISEKSGVDFNEIREIVTVSLYKYNIEEIGTEVAIVEEDSTEKLLQYFCIGKLGSNKTQGTCEQYCRVVRQLCDFVNKEIKDITSEDIQYYLIMWKKNYNNKDSTMESKRLYLSSVFGYLHKHKKISDNPMLMIEAISYRECVKYPLSDEEIERIRVACGNDVRKLAIVDFFLETGVRVSELCNLKIMDIDFVANRCKVLGKGNKERFVYFSGKCKVRLQKYLESRDDIGEYQAPLFLSNDSKGHKMHRAGISKIVKEIGKRAGIHRLHCHLFRATYATNLAKRGVGIEIIARALGHANLNTISRYVLLGEDQINMELKRAGYAA